MMVWRACNLVLRDRNVLDTVWMYDDTLVVAVREGRGGG
jgi:hypothetical protein